MLLMQGDGQNIIALIVDGLGTVAVVHVPIDNCDPQTRAGGDCALDGDGNIGQKTKPIWEVWQAMVTGRAGQCIGILYFAFQNRFDGRFCETGRQGGNFIAARSEGCRAAQLSALFLPRILL